ncbi:hypothetical protein GY45DRAFT_947835 [Cubamyces sp. BRFM 1775]|nr:hypothetical protein GY45DRAFT_947835 [Cubamyces sp. BRFM 1775]
MLYAESLWQVLPECLSCFWDAALPFYLAMKLQHILAFDSAKQPGAVLQCLGWVELGANFLKTVANMSPSCADALLTHGDHNARGFLLEDLPDSETLLIKNVTPAIADWALRALQSISRHLLIATALLSYPLKTEWSGRILATLRPAAAAGIYISQRSPRRVGAGLGFYLQETHSIIGYDANADTIDPLSLCDATPATSMSPSLPRPGKGVVNEAAASIILAFPEINYFSWNLPLLNLTPAPAHDDHFNTPELLQAAQAAYISAETDPFASWYRTCPSADATPPVTL